MYLLGITDYFSCVFTEKFDWKYCHTAVTIGMFAIIDSRLLSS